MFPHFLHILQYTNCNIENEPTPLLINNRNAYCRGNLETWQSLSLSPLISTSIRPVISICHDLLPNDITAYFCPLVPTLVSRLTDTHTARYSVSTLATQRQHDNDDDVALQDLDKWYYPLNHASLRPSRFLFKRRQLFFFFFSIGTFHSSFQLWYLI